MTKKTKEAIKATTAIVIAVAAIFTLWIYPLNQSGKIIARPEQESQSVPQDQLGLSGDTVKIVTEDNLKLNGALFAPAKPRGTFILVHGLFADGGSQWPKAKALVDSGFDVFLYDQRGYGGSEGRFFSGGYFEANDLQSVVSQLDLRNRLVHPVIVWGEDHGGTAGIREWQQESRIDFVVAENPVVYGRDWQKRIIAHRQMSAPDLLLPVIWWWMKQKSGYEIPIEETDISDQVGWALTNKPGKMLLIACGSGDRPDNRYVEKLKTIGGAWMVFPCIGPSLFAAHQEQLLAAVMKMVTSPKP